jgi:hypothetical protein
MGCVWTVVTVFFPLDDELELLPGKLTPSGQERLVKLSSYVPFENAVELFEDFTGIKVSQDVGRRHTEEAGAVYEELQKEEAGEIQKKRARATARPERIQVSADGAMVPLLHGVWAEVKTLVIGEVQPVVVKDGERVVKTRNLSYFSRKMSAEEFERLSLVEIHRRGVENAREVAAIMDGAEWEQSYIDYHCSRAVRILDFAHAAEHISPVGDFLHGEQTAESKTWLETHLHDLKHSGPKKVLLEFQKLQRRHPQEQVVSANLAYLKKREEQIQYPTFQAQGWPIGSGIVESGNKLVVEARLKGSGMHWAEQHVNPMLALRNMECSKRWKEDWPRVEARLRKNYTSAKQEVPQPKVVSEVEAFALILKEKLSPDPLPSDLSVFSKNPKPNHWRNFKHGKALYQRKDHSPKF